MTRAASAHGVVILLPPEVRRDIQSLRKKLSLLATDKPPHITVKSPFIYRCTGAWIVQILEAVCERFEPFELNLRGFGSFGNEVIYIQVEPSPPLLELHRTLLSELVGYADSLSDLYEGDDYLPHLTIADRLAPEDYAQARKLLNGTFPRLRVQVDKLHLLSGKGRHIGRSFPLGQG